MARRDFARLKRRRLRAAGLFEQGSTQAEVARHLDVSRTTTLRWYTAWAAAGTRGLEGAGRAGRKPRLSRTDLAAVEQVLLAGPRAAGYETELWTLERIRQVIRETTGVDYHRGHVWKVLRRLGWSRQKPTTRARERDEEAIGRWIRETWPEVKKTPHATRRTSSSSTRPGSPSGPRSTARGRRAGKRRS